MTVYGPAHAWAAVGTHLPTPPDYCTEKMTLESIKLDVGDSPGDSMGEFGIAF